MGLSSAYFSFVGFQKRAMVLSHRFTLSPQRHEEESEAILLAFDLTWTFAKEFLRILPSRSP